jgi:hypothetical protein
MKKICFLVGSLFAILSLNIGASEASQIRDDGFRGMPFGASLDDFSAKKWELSPSNDSGGDKARFQTFIRTDEQKVLGDITLLDITYYFLDGKFYGVLLQTADGNQTEIMRQALVSSRGEPLHALLPVGGSVWIGSSSTAILQRNQETGEGTVMIVGNALQQRYEAYVKDAGGKIGKDL